MIDRTSEPEPGPSSGRAAFVISQSYSYVAAVVGVGLLLGGGIAALVALRQWILPSSNGGFGPGLDPSREAGRSLLGALAFVVPGALLFVWHIRAARRGQDVYRSGAFWGSVLYFHLVALIAMAITLGGVIGGLHALRDAAIPYCYRQPEPLSPVATPVPGISSGSVQIPADAADAFAELQRDCYPPTADALRSALDAAIVTGVAGAVWAWHLRRGRREFEMPPPDEPRKPAPPPSDA